MIDNNLKFDIHVDYIKNKIQKRIGAMYYRGCSLLPVKYRKKFKCKTLHLSILKFKSHLFSHNSRFSRSLSIIVNCSIRGITN